MSVIFDGTTHVAEAMAIVVRYVSRDWKITQRLVRALLVTKTMCGEEVARELIATLSINLGVASGHLLAAMRDRSHSGMHARYNLIAQESEAKLLDSKNEYSMSWYNTYMYVVLFFSLSVRSDSLNKGTQ